MVTTWRVSNGRQVKGFRIVGNVLLGISIALSGALIGCNPAPSTPAGNTAAKPSLADLVAQLEKHTVAIQAAFEKKDPAAADGPLHEVGHALGDIPAAAKAAGVSPTAQTDIDAALTDLRDAFIVLHDTMHAPAETPASAGTDAHAGHDHPEGEHADHDHADHEPAAGTGETAQNAAAATSEEHPGVKAYGEVSAKIKESLAKLKQAVQAG